MFLMRIFDVSLSICYETTVTVLYIHQLISSLLFFSIHYTITRGGGDDLGVKYVLKDACLLRKNILPQPTLFFFISLLLGGMGQLCLGIKYI